MINFPRIRNIFFTLIAIPIITSPKISQDHFSHRIELPYSYQELKQSYLESTITSLKNKIGTLEEYVDESEKGYKSIKDFQHRLSQESIYGINFPSVIYHREVEIALEGLKNNLFNTELQKKYKYNDNIASLVYTAFHYNIPSFSRYSKELSGEIQGIPKDIIALFVNTIETWGLTETISMMGNAGISQISRNNAIHQGLKVDDKYYNLLMENIKRQISDIRHLRREWIAFDGSISLDNTIADLALQNNTTFSEEAERVYTEYDQRLHLETGLNKLIEELNWRFNYYYNIDDILISYNAGPGRLRSIKAGIIRIPPETKRYLYKFRKMVELANIPENRELVNIVINYGHSADESLFDHYKQVVEEFNKRRYEIMSARVNAIRLKEDFGSYQEFFDYQRSQLKVIKENLNNLQEDNSENINEGILRVTNQLNILERIFNEGKKLYL